jgi:alkyl hydroperoxide reductase subunit AhpC
MKIPLLADKSGKICHDYGVYLEEAGIPLRGLFIIDDKGKLRQITINDLPVGRNVDEALRLIQAFQFTVSQPLNDYNRQIFYCNLIEQDVHGEVCPAGWKPGDDSLKPDPKASKDYFSKH